MLIAKSTKMEKKNPAGIQWLKKNMTVENDNEIYVVQYDTENHAESCV